MIVIDGIIFSLQKHGGISVYFKQLLAYLHRNREQAICLVDEPLLQDVKNIGELLDITRRSARLLERYRPCRIPEGTSVFHSSYYRIPSRFGSPSVVTVHDFIYERYQRGPRQWMHTTQKNAAIHAAQAVICVSESTKQDLLEFVGDRPGQAIHVIHNGVSEVFHHLDTESSFSSFVIFVGQRDGYKNFRLALQALTFLPDIELHCVGGGHLHHDELKGVCQSVAKRVRHLGFVTDEELNVLYNHAICLIYPSSYEGFGIPVVEAMRAGCPVVTANCKAVLEVGQGALIVVADHDPQAMADAILQTVSSERPRLIQNGLAVAQRYSWEATHRQTLEVYRSLGA